MNVDKINYYARDFMRVCIRECTQPNYLIKPLFIDSKKRYSRMGGLEYDLNSTIDWMLDALNIQGPI